MNILAVHPFEMRTMLLHVTSTRSAQLLMTMFSAVILYCVYRTASVGRAPVTGVGQWRPAGRRRRYRSGVSCTALLHSTTLQCIALHSTVLCCTALCCVALHCAPLQCTVLCCTLLYTLHCTVLCCTLLYSPTLYCAVLPSPALHCVVQVEMPLPSTGGAVALGSLPYL